MKWHRATDYHGSRSYTEAPPLSMFSLTLAWIANIVSGKVRQLGGSGRASGYTLPHDGKHGFSLLGEDVRRDARKTPVPVRVRDARPR